MVLLQEPKWINSGLVGLDPLKVHRMQYVVLLCPILAWGFTLSLTKLLMTIDLPDLFFAFFIIPLTSLPSYIDKLCGPLEQMYLRSIEKNVKKQKTKKPLKIGSLAKEPQLWVNFRKKPKSLLKRRRQIKRRRWIIESDLTANSGFWMILLDFPRFT